WELRIVRGNSDTPWNDDATLYQAVAPGGFTSNFPPYRFGSSGSGTNYSSTPVGGTVLIASGGAWVDHDPDGSGSVNVNAIHHAGSTLGTATLGTKTFTLTKLT